MNVQKLGIALVVIFVLFFVVSQPEGSASFVLAILGLLSDAAANVVLFMRSLV